MASYINENQAVFENIREDVYDFIAFMTNSVSLINLKEDSRAKGGYNMCKTLDDIYRDGIIEGEKRGERRGEKRGVKRGKQEELDNLLRFFIKANLAEGNTATEIEDKLVKYFALNAGEAAVYMKLYT